MENGRARPHTGEARLDEGADDVLGSCEWTLLPAVCGMKGRGTHPEDDLHYERPDYVSGDEH